MVEVSELLAVNSSTLATTAMAKLLVFIMACLCVSGSVIGQEDITTITPETTTTTLSPETTTTPAPTTTPPETTTTTAPETTTPPSPDTTTAPPTPEADYKYNITENNITCIMIEGTMNFFVNYSIGNNVTKDFVVTLPKHPKADFKIEGTCNGSEGQQLIEVSWGAVNQTSSFKLEFSGKEGSWTIHSFKASLYLDADIFVNATEAGKNLDLVVNYDFSPVSVPYNHSFSCHSSLSTTNVTGTIKDVAYGLPLSSSFEGIRIQAFSEIPNEPDFVTSVHCAADHTSDVVPIAVGCALAALVVIVLIAYLVGRRRRSAAYQSV